VHHAYLIPSKKYITCEEEEEEEEEEGIPKAGGLLQHASKVKQ
jgi:hypothetical protein